MTQSLGRRLPEAQRPAVRRAGADIVKVNWSGDQRSFGEIIRASDRPVVLAGGSLISDEELLTRMQQAREVGAVGCSVGRNVFQHQNPQAITDGDQPGLPRQMDGQAGPGRVEEQDWWSGPGSDVPG